MRGFIIMCLVAVATAQYNYGTGIDSVYGGPYGGVGTTSGVGPSHSDNLGPSYGGGETNKEFYSFTAPEEEFSHPAGVDDSSNSAKKNLRVIFIKGPENNGLEQAVLNLAKHSAEQKTAIYVLNKQIDIAELTNKFNAVHEQNNHKPEVHFVKYRTPEDAANAQHQIQSQYDGVHGPSSNINGGVAPVINFASAVGPSRQQGGSSYTQSGVGPAPAVNYLPASIIRRFRRV